MNMISKYWLYKNLMKQEPTKIYIDDLEKENLYCIKSDIGPYHLSAYFYIDTPTFYTRVNKIGSDKTIADFNNAAARNLYKKLENAMMGKQIFQPVNIR